VKVHLVDGTYELFRAYFGAPAASAPDGGEVGAVRGFLQSRRALLRQDDGSHVACAFDTVIESFRNELFDGYKRGDSIEPDLLRQFPLAERGCEALGIVCWRMIEFEADDGLATGAARYGREPDVEQVVICSPDKDLCQCVRGREVVCFDRVRRSLRDESGVREKFGVAPGSIPDYLALVGDSADGIPGIPGWGAKSTATVLARYEHLESIPAEVSQWEVSPRGAARLAENLASRRQDARLYKRLATLREDVPLGEELEDLRWRGARREPLDALCEELGDVRLPQRVTRWKD
jgi:5'-3' exonuclease